MPIAYLVDTDPIISRIAIGRSVGLDQAIALISDLEAGRRAKRKAVIG